MTELSQQTVESLNRSGWNPSRIIDTSGFEDSLRAAGFVVFDAAVNFLRQYGGLRIKYPHAKVIGMEDEMHFDPSIAVTHIQSIAVDAYAKVIGKQLCPIGEAARGYLILLMDEDGQVYAAYDEFLAHVGTSGLEAIQALCSGKNLVPIRSAC